MRKPIGIAALAGLAACASPEKMHYEVTQRGTNTVSLQMNVGNMDRESEMVSKMLSHMDGLAVSECRNMGKASAHVTNQTARTTGPYYSWIERSYDCR